MFDMLASRHRSGGLLQPIAILLTIGLLAVTAWPSAAHAQDAAATVLLDPSFRTPAPPNDAFPQNAHHVLVATLGMLALALVFVGVAIREGIRYRSTIPFAIVAGAAFCVIPESIDNYLGGCYWSQSHDPDQLLYFLMGREFDYYVAIMWWAFGAILGYVLYAALIRNVTTATLWIAFAIAGLADILIEETLLGYGGIYTYFGHQPLVLLARFPWWWLFVNVSALFLSIAIIYRFRDWLNGWKSCLILALMPLCYIGGFAFAGMPAIFAVNGDFPWIATQMAGLLSCAIALIQTAGTMYFVLGRHPFALGRAQDDTVTGSTLGMYARLPAE